MYNFIKDDKKYQYRNNRDLFLLDTKLQCYVKVENISTDLYEKIITLQDEYNSTQYQRDRKKEYDKLNQHELQSNDLKNGTTEWLDAINTIKAKYPKPEVIS